MKKKSLQLSSLNTLKNKAMPKVIFIINQLMVGGAEKSTLLLSKELLKLGTEVEVWYLKSSDKKQISLWQSVVPVKKKNKHLLKFYKKPKNETIFLVNNAAHRYISTKTAINIIHSDQTYPFYQATTQKLRKRIFKSLLKRFFPRKSVVVSKRLAKNLSPFTQEYPAYIANPFDADIVIKSSKIQVTHNLSRPYILHVGRISPEKQQEQLLQLYLNNNALQQKVNLAFIGSEADSEQPIINRMKQSIDDKNASEMVHFLGELDNPWSIMAQSECLVLCSETESMGYVILEAMTLNIPIVSTACEGPVEVLGENFTGLAEDFNELDKKIMLALIEPEQFKLSLPNIYQPESVAKQYLDYVLSSQGTICKH